MNLVYNVHYEVASIIFLSVIYIYLNLMYSGETGSGKRFRNLVLLIILATLADVITAVDISYAASLPHWFNILINTLYFLLTAYLLFYYIVYIGSFLGQERKSKNQMAMTGVLVVYVLLLIVNCFTGILFYFDENSVYSHGIIYYIIYGFNFTFVIDGVCLGLVNRKFLPPRQLFSILLFSFLEISGCIVQAVFLPDYLIILFASAVSMVVIMFALETPDYKRLTIALDELKESERKLQIANENAIRARKEAEEANQAKSAFLAAMSHEIRTPINGVLGMNSIIMKETKDSMIREYSKNIENAGNGLLALVNDILDFSKIESGKMEVIPCEYHLSDVLSACYNMVFLRARDKGLDILFENNTTIPNTLYGDEPKIRQIITNLITNAIKYTEKGMVLLTADWEMGERNEMVLIISVKDTGMGIKKENIGKLFDAFTRLDEQKNRNIEGTGLGLKITKQYLDLMDGTIEVESEYGAGSEFTVRIPQTIVGSNDELGEFANYVHISTEEEAAKTYRFRCPKGKILIADDVEMNLKVLRGLLKDTGLLIDTVNSGKEAIEMVGKVAYDVILLDHIMPEMDGIETLQVIQSMDKIFNPKTPVIMLTANFSISAAEEYKGKGFTDYLTKPVKESELNAMLIKYLPSELVSVLDESAETKEVASADAVKDNSTLATQMTAQATTQEVTQNAIHTETVSSVMASTESSAMSSSEVSNESITKPKSESESKLETKYGFLDINVGLEYCMNDENLYVEIVREFRTGSKYDELQELFDKEDWKNYEIIIHGIKSSAKTIGALEVSDLAQGLEVSIKDENYDFVKNNHYIFMRKYGRLLDNLDEIDQ